MRFKPILLCVVAVVFTLIVGVFTAVYAGTAWDGSINSFLRFHEGSVATRQGLGLGVSYRPTVSEYYENARKNVVRESRFLFWAKYLQGEGGDDTAMGGMGFSLVRWPEEGIEVLAWGGPTFMGPSSRTRVGYLGGISIPFKVMDQGFEFSVGGGHTGTGGRPAMLFSFGPTTK